MTEPKEKLTRVHFMEEPEQKYLVLLKEMLNPEIIMTTGNNIPTNANYQILVSGNPTKEFIKASSKLMVLIIPWAGMSDKTRELMMEYPKIAVHNLHHNAIATAEMAISLLFAVAKSMIPVDAALRSNDWTPRYISNHSMLIYGKNALVLGYGKIGSHVAKVLIACGVVVKGVRHNSIQDDGNEIIPMDQFTSVLPDTDFLVICLPHTNETRGLIGRKELSLLKQGAIIVNVGRGPVVDQQALYNALQKGQIGGAGLDVWYNYPTDESSRKNTPPADFPFYKLDNVVLSPHRGGGTKETEELRMTALADLLNRASQGLDLPNLVDVNKGY